MQFALIPGERRRAPGWQEHAVGAQGEEEQVHGLTLGSKKGQPMRHTYGTMLGGLLAALCLVSTLAVAGEMTCTASDGKGNCTAATGPDGTTLVVVGEGLKVGELMGCQDRGNMIDCHAVRRN